MRIMLAWSGIACCGVAIVLLLPARAAEPMPGAKLFQQSGCEQCHGPAGLGTDDGPSLAGIGKRLSADKIKRQIREGGSAMPAFDEALTPGQIDQLGTWLETWKRPA